MKYFVKPKIYESRLQQTCVEWFRLKYKDKIIFAIPNGGSRNILEAVALKRQGVLKGVPDLFIAEPVGKFHGLWIEMKVMKNKLTDEQKNMIEALNQRGFRAEVCREFETFQKMVEGYLNEDFEK